MKVVEDQVVEDDASFQDDEVRHFILIKLTLGLATYNIVSLENPLSSIHS